MSLPAILGPFAPFISTNNSINTNLKLLLYSYLIDVPSAKTMCFPRLSGFNALPFRYLYSEALAKHGEKSSPQSFITLK